MDDRKVLLSIKDLYVKFHVRGRVLTAIRGVSHKKWCKAVVIFGAAVT